MREVSLLVDAATRTRDMLKLSSYRSGAMMAGEETLTYALKPWEEAKQKGDARYLPLILSAEQGRALRKIAGELSHMTSGEHDPHCFFVAQMGGEGDENTCDCTYRHAQQLFDILFQIGAE